MIDLELLEEGERLREARMKLEARAAGERGPGVGRPGGRASPPAPARPRGAEPGMPGAAGAAPLLDARTASHADLVRHVGNMGLDPSVFSDDHCTRVARENARPPAPEILAAESAARDAARERRERRAEAIAGTAIDARSATPEEVQARLAALLGREGAELAARETQIRPVGKPLPSPRSDADAAREAGVRAQDVRRRVRDAVAGGRPLDAREMGPVGNRARLESLGLSAPDSWGPAQRSPPRR